MSAHTQDPGAQQSAEQRRRKRRERAAKSRTPEPKNIVSGAGQPLDPGVRRELEDRLGHDLSRVRLHTDRDAARLTELLGADAVAVGQDILFRAGAFKPGTDEGRRLLAHELLHTVQNPHGLGALRAGREPGAVSLPRQAIEQEAESAAQDLVRPATEESAPRVTENQSTPGWLRYATVDADRNRVEAMDPATLLDRLANSVVRSLRGDPEDLSHRTRRQLARLPEELLDGVLVRLENRLLAPEQDRVLDLVEEVGAYDVRDQDLEADAPDAPEIEPDAAEQVRTERENALRSREQRRAEDERPALAPGPEKARDGDEGAAGSTPRNGGTPEHGTTPRGGDAPHRVQEKTPGPEGSARGPARAAAPARQERTAPPAASGGAPGSGQRGDTETAAPAGREQDRKGEAGGSEQTEETRTPAASEEESAARNRPAAAEAAVAGQQVKPQDKGGREKPTGSPTVSGTDPRLPGPFSTLEGRRDQDVEGLEEEADDDPSGSGSESEVEVGGGERSAWDVRLQPEDFLPARDLDVSAVPTAEKLDPGASAAPSVPSFPAAPPTKADQVQAERDAEDAEEAAAGPEEETPEPGAEPEPGPSARETEGGPDGGAGPAGLGPAVDQAAALPPASGTRDPKSGDDPKAGPVTAQTTVQQAPGRAEGASEGGGAAGETAAKEEKGTPAAGDKGVGGQEKESPKATGGQSAQRDTEAKETGAGAGSTGNAGREAVGAQGAGAPESTQNPPAGATGSTPPSGASHTSGAAGEPTRETRTTTVAPEPRSAPAAATSAPPPARTATESAAGPESAPRSAPAPQAATGGAARSGGGGGGAAPARPKGRKDSAPAPDLSGVSPEAGLATASKLKPHKALQAMGGVGGAVDRSVGDEHKALASAPPSMQRPAGAPRTLSGKPRTDAPAEYSQDKPQEAQAPEQKDAEVTGEKEPEGQIEAEKAEEPGGWDTFKMALGFIGGKIVNGIAGFFGADKPVVDPQALAAKFAGLPTKDEALRQARAGNAPGVGMTDAAEQTAGEQDGHVDDKGRETISTARDDAGRGMGEDQVYPDAPKERMTAKVPGAQGGQGGAVDSGGATGAVPAEAASEVAEHDRGPQFRAAFTDGAKSMSEGRQAKDRDVRDAQDRHKKKVDAEIEANTRSQAGERQKAMGEVTARREDWRKEQDGQLKSLGDKKSERHDKVRKDVEEKEKKTDDDVDKEKEGSDKKIRDESDKAERDAAQKRDGAAQESGNWVSKAFDWIKQKVIEIKNAIVRVIRAARDAVVGFIKNFKDTVERWIDEARKNIVDAIKNLIKDLIEFAVAMVRAVIELAARIRKFVTDLVSAAIALVNRLAQALKQAVSDLLDAIGKLLGSLLDILKKALQAAVKAVVAAVKSVLEFASKLLGALGAWMMIAVDFLSDPGGWLGGAKNSAVDGAKNHLFREVSTAVKSWFQEKIQEIIGVPKAIIDKLVKGGISLDQIVKEAWDAVVPQLPLIIGELVMTKVVAKLIPGAGWVMAVIDAIRTAWGALSAILRSLEAVLTWLKAVRVGGAGILFAKAVAAGVVALLEVLYQALLNQIGKYVAKVGRRLRGVAARLTKDRFGKPGGRRRAGAEDGGSEGSTRKPEEKEPAGRKPAADAKTPRETDPMPTRDKAGTPAQPKKPGDPDPTAKDKNGRPKDPTGKPDTSPTPSAKPEPEPRPKRGSEPESKDRDSNRPRSGDKDTPGRRKPDTDQENPKNKPRDKDSDGPGKPKSKAEDGDNRRPRREDKGKDKDGRKRKPEHEPKGPRRKRDQHESPHSKEKDPANEKEKKKDQRKKDEKSKESKEERLQKIAARVRPLVKRTLDKGTDRRVLGMTLAALRRWYRLTGLDMVGSALFSIRARLNPDVEILGGCAEVDRDDLLRYIRELGAELRTRTERERNSAPGSAPPVSFGQVTHNGGPSFDVEREIRGASAGALAEHLDTAADPQTGTVLGRRRRQGDTDNLNFIGDPPQSSTSVGRYLKKGGNPRNFLITVRDPFTQKMTDPSYGQLKTWMEKLKKNPGRFSKVNVGLRAFLKNTTHSTGSALDDEFVRGVGTWVILAEGSRNPAAMVTQVMAVDLATQGKMDWSTAVDMMPMSKANKRELEFDAAGEPVRTRTGKQRWKTTQHGAVEESDRLRSHLYGRGLTSPNSVAMADSIAAREVAIIKEWVSHLNIVVDDPTSKQEVLDKVKAVIRSRMEDLYGR